MKGLAQIAVVATMVLAWLAHPILLIADPDAPAAALVLDHDMLQSLARTGSPGIALEYTPERVLLKTRFRAVAIWVDVRLEAVFVRAGPRVQLALRRLTAGGVVQNASRFDEAAAKLSKLVNVETSASRVEIYKAGRLVYAQNLGE